MEQVKYFLLARLIKLLVQFAFFLVVIFFCFNLYLRLSDKPNIKIGRGTLGHATRGYNVRATMALSIPDTLIYLKDGNRVSTENSYRKKINDSSIKFKVVNKFSVYEDKQVTVSNDIHIPDNVAIRVISKNYYHNLFWAITEFSDLIFYGITLLILIKLINRYMDAEFFEKRSFTLVTFLGLILIGSEVFNFIVNYINMKIFQSPVLDTRSLISDDHFNFNQVNIHPAGINFSNIVIGILIILLSQVLKEAIIAKKEQELTI